MQTTSASVFHETFVFQDVTAPLMEVHIVDINDIFYKKGRILAENVYRQVWNTENLIDGNDYAVVVSLQGEVIGNMNLQVKSSEKLLKSETFFGQEHWKDYFCDSDASIAELSALAISRSVSQEISQYTMMSLIAGMNNLCRLKNIKLLVTVQHQCLIRMLTKRLNLPFVKNPRVTIPQESVPDDDYWKTDKHPGLYYLNTLSSSAIESAYSILTYLTLTGIPTAFFPRVQKTDLCYSTFRENCNKLRETICLN